MQNNTGLLVAVAALFALSGLCCVGAGAGYFVFARGRAAAPPVAYPPTAYPPYVPPTPPSGPAMPPPPMPTPTAASPLFETSETPVRGPVGAPITIHVVSDFQCPFCSRAEPTLTQLDQLYPGQIRWVWHDYPLPFHTDAMPAAEAAREVRRQLGDPAFWTYHDQLFANQQELDGRNLERMASALAGIDVARFRQALVAHEHQAEVRASVAIIDAAHPSTGTPSFLVGSTWVVGAQPITAFQTEINRQLGR